MAKRKPKKEQDKKDDKKLFAFLATFLSIIGFVIALIAKRDDDYVMYYAAQSMVVFIAACIAAFVQTIALLIPILGQIIKFALGILVFLAWLFSWIYSLSGETKPVPVIGVYGEKIKL